MAGQSDTEALKQVLIAQFDDSQSPMGSDDQAAEIATVLVSAGWRPPAGPWPRYHPSAPIGAAEAEGHRSIGRFAHEFSRVIDALRSEVARMTVAHTGAPEPDTTSLMLLMSGEMTASPLTNAFFAVAEDIGTLNAADQAEAKAIRGVLADLTNKRNDFFHGEWEIRYDPKSYAPQPPILHRTKPGRKGSKVTATSYTVEQIDLLADEAQAIRDRVVTFANKVRPSRMR